MKQYHILTTGTDDMPEKVAILQFCEDVNDEERKELLQAISSRTTRITG